MRSTAELLPVEGLIVADEASLEAKLAQIAADGADNLHVVLDFDRTITVGKQGEDDCTSWQVLQRHLPPEGQERYAAYYRQYRPMELDGSITEEDAYVWSSSVLRLFAEYRVDLNKVEEDFLNVVDIRPGTRELFAVCHERGVPITIMSAGVKDVIDVLLAKSGLQADIVLASQLITDEAGTVVDWQREPVIHFMNKHEAGHEPLERLRAERPNCLVVGDAMGDADMANGDEGIVRVRVIDPRPDETKTTDEIRQETFRRFDALTESGSLQCMATLVGQLAVRS